MLPFDSDCLNFPRDTHDSAKTVQTEQDKCVSHVFGSIFSSHLSPDYIIQRSCDDISSVHHGNGKLTCSACLFTDSRSAGVHSVSCLENMLQEMSSGISKLQKDYKETKANFCDRGDGTGRRTSESECQKLLSNEHTNQLSLNTLSLYNVHVLLQLLSNMN